MARDLSAELQYHDGQALPFWDPKPGDQIVGRILRYEDRTTKFGPTKVVVVEREDGIGRVAVWLSAVVLRNLFDKESPQVGERIGVKFLGVPAGKTYRSFTLLVDRDDRREALPLARTSTRPTPRPPAPVSGPRGPAEADPGDPFVDQ